MGEIETKDKIIQTALPLFAEFGFSGVSIRSLAKEAGVNIAAINYHFQNKENLYYSVVEYSYLQIQKNIEDLESQKQWEIEPFVLAMFDMFLEKGMFLVNTFKILISGGKIFDQLCQSGCFNGPSGAMSLSKILDREVPGVHLKEKRQFIHLIFSQITHSAVILSSISFHDHPEVVEREYSLKFEEIREALMMLVEMGLDHLKNNRKNC
ncbi:MAG: hypothetical protein CL678_08105 [Bdellovibrionaceae bacterium]|nr:hypothetical protein [Pseudobdellovibrionaceae bacterium]|tara:strand:+ start:4644 stop:5270 length:627 start_codon:yes stop_codon:yes gene_type:complete